MFLKNVSKECFQRMFSKNVSKECFHKQLLTSDQYKVYDSISIFLMVLELFNILIMNVDIKI